MRLPTFKLSTWAKKILLRVGVGVVILYLAFGALVLWSMHQPPERFAKVMSKMPGPVPFLLFPFETAWLRARNGHLNMGDPAPDFSLAKVDKTAPIQLSVLNQHQPVVLVFGSYT